MAKVSWLATGLVPMTNQTNMCALEHAAIETAYSVTNCLLMLWAKRSGCLTSMLPASARSECKSNSVLRAPFVSAGDQ